MSYITLEVLSYAISVRRRNATEFRERAPRGPVAELWDQRASALEAEADALEADKRRLMASAEPEPAAPEQEKS